ncbi:hypothetical protein AAHH80_39020, partial [Burkholderia pseudomallei]
MADNIVHLVLSRTPDAPVGVNGFSLFIVPKFLVNDDGILGARNDVHCAVSNTQLRAHETHKLMYYEVFCLERV